MSMIRLIYLVSVATNICGHMCLFCAVGELLVAQVSERDASDREESNCLKLLLAIRT